MLMNESVCIGRIRYFVTLSLMNIPDVILLERF
jgi:hypothetical protein